MAEVPTIFLTHLSEAQIAVYKIADNRLSELSTWDDKLLAESLQDLTLLNLDFSLELTGFDVGEIDMRIEGLEIVPEKGRADPADAVPEAVAGPAVTQRRARSPRSQPHQRSPAISDDSDVGSGTTLIAAERVGRCCFGLELDPLYVDTIIRRWQALTGDEARHGATGMSFAETEAARVSRERDVP